MNHELKEIASSFIVLTSSLPQSVYHKRPRSVPPWPMRNFTRAGALGAMAFIAQAIGAAIDPLIDAATGEVDHEEWPG